MIDPRLRNKLWDLTFEVGDEGMRSQDAETLQVAAAMCLIGASITRGNVTALTKVMNDFLAPTILGLNTRP